MYRRLARPSWTCVRCLAKLSRLEARRHNSSVTNSAAVASVVDPGLSPADHALPWASSIDLQQDDRALRDVFDSQQFWLSFTQAARTRPAGLVQNNHLRTADGFSKFTQSTLARCRRIVDRTVAASTIEGYVRMARDLDQLSDLLCRVIDLSDFMRAAHPEPRFLQAANNAHAAMFEYMNELNTDSALNEQLKKAISIPEVANQWSEEEKIVARILIKDFSNSAIDLPEKDRKKFVKLSSEISIFGTEFIKGIESAHDTISLDPRRLNGVEPTLIKSSLSWNGKVNIPTNSYEAHQIINFAHDEEVRKTMYKAQRNSSKGQIHRLEGLLQRRAELAKLSGHQSFAHMNLSDKMAKSPEAVHRFLTTLCSTNKPSVRGELSRLDPAVNNSVKLAPWNYPYKLQQAQRSAKEARASRSRHLARLPAYFSLGTVMQGISRLFTMLYGVRLVPRETPPAETWSSNVRRLDVIHETEGHLAVIYCDLFARPNKSPNPAHFTLRCSRELTEEELDPQSDELPNDGMPLTTGISRITGDRTVYQLPVIALVCDFPHPSRAMPSLLSFHNVVTLFHEMGHAIHSILGRTSLQSISGTRCPTDFAELPSVLMESFAADPTVLSMYARHYSTNEPLTPEMISAMLEENRLRASYGGAMANESQILMSLVDQAYHSLPANASSIDSTAIYHEIYSRYGSLDSGSVETSWQGSFGHLFGYGATYYSYLFDRAIARRVWQQVFQSGKDDTAVSRDAGEKFKDAVLRWGGGRDPWVCLEDLLGQGEGVLAEGKEKAMLEVGKWGVGVGEGDAVGLG